MLREYKRASEPFEKFPIDARDCALLQTTNQSCTMAQGVLQAFRRRVCVKDALSFADIATMTREVRGLRPDHNMSSASAIRDVARALLGNVDGAAPDCVPRPLAGRRDGVLAIGLSLDHDVSRWNHLDTSRLVKQAPPARANAIR